MAHLFIQFSPCTPQFRTFSVLCSWTSSKGKDVPVRTMKSYGWLDVQFQSFLSPALYGTDWSAPRPDRFTCGVKSSLYPLNMRLGGPQSKSGSFQDERNLLPLPGNKTQLIPPARTLITRPTELSRIPHPKSNYIITVYLFIPFLFSLDRNSEQIMFGPLNTKESSKQPQRTFP